MDLRIPDIGEWQLRSWRACGQPKRQRLLRVVRRLPSNLAVYGMLSHEGQESDNP
jgi:hypothetical protein